MAKGIYTPENPAKYHGDARACKECGFTFKSVMSLARHLTQKHAITCQAYWDKHFLITNCIECGKPTKFKGIGKGYAKVCSHVCGGVNFRKQLRADPYKQEQFARRVSSNQKAIWSQRSDSEKKAIFEKIAYTSFRSKIVNRPTTIVFDDAWWKLQARVSRNLDEVFFD